MAKHEIVIHENTGATKDAVPYLGGYIEKETIRQEGFIALLGAKSGLPTVQMQAILEGCFELIREIEKEGLVRIHTDIGTVCAIITGSFPTADAAFNPERNKLLLVLQLPEAELTGTGPGSMSFRRNGT